MTTYWRQTPQEDVSMSEEKRTRNAVHKNLVNSYEGWRTARQ